MPGVLDGIDLALRDTMLLGKLGHAAATLQRCQNGLVLLRP